MTQFIVLENLLINSKDLLMFARQFAGYEGTCLLFSGSQYETANHSFLGLFPYDILRIQEGWQLRQRLEEKVWTKSEKNPWDNLRVLQERGDSSSFPEWMGFLSYEMGAYSDPEKHIVSLPSEFPMAYWQRCALVLRLDQRTQKIEIKIVEGAENLFSDERREWIRKLSSVQGWEEFLNPLKSEKLIVPQAKNLKCVSRSDSLDSYCRKIQAIQELIRAGEVYQLNLSQQFEFQGQVSAFDLFCDLATSNPAPFSAYFGMPDFSIVCSSPERFLLKSADRLESRPIKGTIPRGETHDEDEIRKKQLQTSPKEKAELLMITDLMRNDLGKISKPGSVKVPLVWGCEAYQNVYHLYSIVYSQAFLNDSIGIIKACFPGGSITGCPKLRAMEAIVEFEQRPRNIYTGSIGYLAGNGNFDLNIAIRTAIVKDDLVNVQLGGGIVIDSDPLQEYQETLHKGRSIFKALGMAEQTIL